MLHSIDSVVQLIKKRPARMFLIFLQIAIAVSSVILVLNMVFFIKYQIVLPNQGLLYNVTYINKNNRYNYVEPIFSEKILSDVQSSAKYITGASMYWYGNDTLIFDNVLYKTSKIVGVNASYVDMLNLRIIQGHFFSNSDVQQSENVIIISEVAKDYLFGDENPIGKTIKLSTVGDKPFSVLGVFSHTNQGQEMLKTHFIIPYTCINKSVNPKYETVLVQFNEQEIKEGIEELNLIINSIVPENVKNDLKMGETEIVFSDIYEEDQDVKKEILNKFVLLIGGFTFLALIVSFIGILSIMLVSVVERAYEIGLRRALGACKRSIITKIIGESIMISLMGGIFGTGVAIIVVKPIIRNLILSNLFSQLMTYKFTIHSYPIIISLGGCIIIGFISGVLPAINATKISIVDIIKRG